MSVSIPEEVRALIGVKRTRSHYVTEHEIMRFAQATGNSVSRSGGVIEAPLLFPQALAYEAVPLDQLPADGSPRELDVPIPAARTVGGSSEYVIHRRVRAGETVTIEFIDQRCPPEARPERRTLPCGGGDALYWLSR